MKLANHLPWLLAMAFAAPALAQAPTPIPAQAAAPAAPERAAERPEAAVKALRPSRQNAQLNDPFEVSPQLREGRRGTRFAGLPGANVLDLQRRVQLKAILRTTQGTLAQLLINHKDTLTVMHKELIDLGDLGTFLVEVDSGTVTLSNPSTPQGKKVVLR